MALSTGAKALINNCLSRAQLRLDTTTTENSRRRRLTGLEATGHFDRPAFPAPRCFNSPEYKRLLKLLLAYRERLDSFDDATHNDVGYTFDNSYFSSPDAEVLYTIVRSQRPQTVVEVGSGNSTRLIRQAIIDSEGTTRIVSIDPYPRIDIAGFSDAIHTAPVEDLGVDQLASWLKTGDILFIDSSHLAATGSDDVFLYLGLIPRLPPGVLIHAHDIWLPYDYPRQWAEDYQWNEQYVVQAMLAFGCGFDVLWAGHYLEHTVAEFERYFPHRRRQPALSLWLRKIDAAAPGLSASRETP